MQGMREVHEIMKLEDIGFYTLSDNRARHTSIYAPLQRCEIILTDICNLKCLYCRGLKEEYAGHMPKEKALNIINLWAKEGLLNIRFSGGEPMIYPHIEELVGHASKLGINRIALSTNGTASIDRYRRLIALGVNDLSISLDSGCCSTSNVLAGGINGAWERASNAIKVLSALTYVTVGVVINEINWSELPDTINYIKTLKPSDIRIIPSAQYNRQIRDEINIDCKGYPILSYRINNIKNGRHVRGLSKDDCDKCYLVLDDMAIVGDYHYPCIIYLREQGSPIGKVWNHMRSDRQQWLRGHNSHDDSICKANCLDVCVDYNNTVARLNVEAQHNAKD